MNRNKKQANIDLFNALSSRITARAVPEAIRYIATANDFEKNWLIQGEIVDEFRFDSANRVLEVKCDKMNCVVLVNFPAPPEMPEGLALTFMNPGLFTVLAVEARVIREDIDELFLYDTVFLPAAGDYQGHSWTTLEPFYQSMTVLAIDPDGPFGGPGALARIVLYLSASVGKLRTLAISGTTLTTCQTIALDHRSQIPFALMAHALVAVRWEHCFLEFYRCIERLFSLPTVVSLKGELGIAVAGVAVSSILEKIIGWRKNEEAGLLTLLEECDAVCRRFHRLYIHLDETMHRDYTAKSVATYVYQLRNSIVHYRPATDLPELEDAAWVELVNFLIDLVVGLYTKFRIELVTTAASTAGVIQV